MCGFLLYTEQAPSNPALFKESFKTIKTRGPDFAGEESLKISNRSLQLAQNILAINSKNYPIKDSVFTSECKRFKLLYNGENYNYSPSEQNTEFKFILDNIIHKGILEFVKNVEGMFSIVLIDLLEETISFCVDPSSEKQLFFTITDNTFGLSSEIRPLIKLSPSSKICREKLTEYIHTRHFMMSEKTNFQNIQKAEKSTLYRLDLKKFKITREKYFNDSNLIDSSLYYHLSLSNEEKVINLLHQALNENLELLTLSPQQIHTAFSGGIDSTLINLLLSKQKKNVHAHALLFGEKDPVVAEAARKFSGQITKLKVTKETFAEEMDKCLERFCSPLPTHSSVSQALLAKSVSKSDGKILLGGDGADELAGGYEAYKEIFRDAKTDYSYNPSPYSGSTSTVMSSNFKTSMQTHKAKLMKQWDEAISLYSFIPCKKEQMLKAMLFLDFVKLFPSVALYSCDVSSMMYSVENRSIFANNKVARLILSMPIKYLINSNNNIVQLKHSLTQLIKSMYPSFSVPEKQGFSGYPNEAAHLLIQKPCFNLVNDYFNYNFNKHTPLNRADEWKLLNLELFLERFQSYV